MKSSITKKYPNRKKQDQDNELGGTSKSINVYNPPNLPISV